MLSKAQIQLIHIARKLSGLNEAQYRTVLRSAGGVASSTALTQASFEDVMAVLEDCGFTDAVHGADYWRNKVAARGTFCGDRMAYKIEELAPLQRYAVSGLCQRFSDGRTDQVRKLSPREAWMLIEMLKAAAERDPVASPRLAPPTPTAAEPSLFEQPDAQRIGGNTDRTTPANHHGDAESNDGQRPFEGRSIGI